MSNPPSGNEQRKDLRVPKQLSMTYRLKAVDSKVDTSIAKDVSKGGIRFNSYTKLKENDILVIEMIIPYLAPNKTIVEAQIVGIKPVSNVVSEIRAKFINLRPEDEKALSIIEQVQIKGAKPNYGSY